MSIAYEVSTIRRRMASVPEASGCGGLPLIRARALVAGTIAGIALAVASGGPVLAAGEVEQLFTSERGGTPYRYQRDGIEYTWGLGNNLLLEGFGSDGRRFGYALTADRVELRRDDVPDMASGNPCGVFVERLDASSTQLAADYPDSGSGEGDCDMAELLRSRTLNRGALDVFSNRAPDAKNIERIDYLFDSGILAPVTPEGLDRAGHVVAEKGGNNRVKIAAILSLDAFGQPASYGPVVLVRQLGCMDPDVCFGTTDVMHHYAFFRNDATMPQGMPSAGRQSTESVTMAFVSSERLGLGAGQRYFGFSLFADDVDTDDHDLSDPASFPDDTQDEQIAPGDAADIYGGLSGYFIADDLSNGRGRVFLDANADGVPGDDEAGIADIQIQLYRDTDGDGIFDPARDEPVCNATDTDMNGEFVLPGLPDGEYFGVVRENDPELPSGLVPGAVSNPLPFSVAGNDVDGLNFPFVSVGGGSSPGGAGGATAGGVDAGGADAGGADAGGVDAGGADAGGVDAGGADAGGADAGGADAGGVDAGGADAGGVDAGGADAGGADAGGADAGGADAGGADAGGVDAGGADAGGADAGGADAGGVDAGGADAGGVDAGGADAGGADAGGVDAGGADGGGADAGGVDAGGVDAGGADAGGADAGGADAGGADAGGVDAGGVDAGGADAGGVDTGGADAGGADAGGADAGGTDAGGTTDGGTTGISQPGPGTSRDEPTTRTEPDSFTVLQGGFATVDVLANDVDASGGGLTLIRVADSPNATIEIANNQIVYTPNPSFYGDDNFVYEIRDGDGNEFSGTASAEVIRYTDINGNGENDFIECNCTDLTLETGVHGSGVGRLADLGLLTLGMLLLMRLLVRRTARREVQQ